MAIGVHCCKNCVPPKRNSQCHSTCKEYLNEKTKYEEDKKKARADIANIPYLTNYDFNEIDYMACKRHKRRSRR